MLGIILVNYKTINETVDYIIQQLSKVTTPNKVVVVDVARDNFLNSREIANKCGGQVIENINFAPDNDKWVYILPHRENLGYAKGNNIGAAYLMKHFNIEYFLFSNNDIKFYSNDVVEKLIKQASLLPDVGAIGPRVIGWDDKNQSPRKYLSIWRMFIIPYLLWPIRVFLSEQIIGDIEISSDSRYCYWVSGAFVIVKANCFKMIQGFDPNTFLYSEESILSERLLGIGMKNYFYADVKVSHANSSVIGHWLQGGKNMRLMFDSKYYYFKKYIGVSKCELALAKFIVLSYLNIIYPIAKFTKEKFMIKLTR